MSKAWSGGSTGQWRQVRAEVLERDQHCCRLRYEHCAGHATEVHHLDGKANGDNLTRCVAACKRCHAKDTRQQTTAAAAKRPRAKRPIGRHPGLL